MSHKNGTQKFHCQMYSIRNVCCVQDVHTHTHTHARMHINACTHTHIHMYTHTLVMCLTQKPYCKYKRLMIELLYELSYRYLKPSSQMMCQTVALVYIMNSLGGTVVSHLLKELVVSHLLKEPQ